MGSVFGKENVAEPAFEVLLDRVHAPVQTSYEIRSYGERFAAETTYAGNSDDSPFRLLAQYIGVFGNPQNEASESISMTAPVMKSTSESGTAIAMTAPVMRSSTHDQGEKTMQFVLPAEYNELSKIPKPTNPKVHIKEIPPQVGAVHRYSGSMSDSYSEKMAMELAAQLRKDGIDISDADALKNYNFWGYNPPFCLPAFRRNEVWIPMSMEQAEQLVKEFDPADAN